MSEDQKNKEVNKDMNVNVTVDRSAEIEALQKELKKIEEEARGHKSQAEKLAQEKAALEQEKGNIISEKEQLEGTLATIAEKEFKAKREALMSRVTKSFNPEDKRYLDIKARLEDQQNGPQNLKEIEYTMNILEEAMEKGKAEMEAFRKREEEKQKAGTPPPAPSGGTTAMLSQEQLTGGVKKDEEGYDSYEAAITDTIITARDSKDPAKRAEAQSILDQFWKKWAIQVHKDFEQHTNISQIHDIESKEKKHHGVGV
jgi:DNA repair exonuclease SbcCD ATPase subunit